MCMPQRPRQAQQPAPSPPPPQAAADVQGADPAEGSSSSAMVSARRRGRSSLRIDLGGTGDSGLNIPT